MGFRTFTNVFIYNAVCYGAEFPAFIDNSKGLLTCIQDCNTSGECTTPLMSLGLTGQAAAGVRRCSLKVLNVDIWMSDEWDRGPADATGIYQEKREPWMLDFWTSDAVFKPVFTGMTISLTTAPQNGKHFYISSSSHTDKALPIFSKNDSSRHARYCCTSWRSDLNVSPILVIIFPDERVHWFVYTLMTSEYRSVHSPV